MLVATVAALLIIFGGGGLGHYLVNADKAIKKTVEDKDVRRELSGVTKQLAKDLKKGRKTYQGELDNLLDLPQEYGVSPEAFDRQIKRIMTVQQHLVETTLDAREQMRQRMTEDQWQAVFATEP